MVTATEWQRALLDHPAGLACAAHECTNVACCEPLQITHTRLFRSEVVVDDYVCRDHINEVVLALRTQGKRAASVAAMRMMRGPDEQHEVDEWLEADARRGTMAACAIIAVIVALAIGLTVLNILS